MAVVYIFAHFDDEYCALPLVAQGVAAGEDQWFLYVADYARPQLIAASARGDAKRSSPTWGSIRRGRSTQAPGPAPSTAACTARCPPPTRRWKPR